jgi:hypothetical protein
MATFCWLSIHGRHLSLVTIKFRPRIYQCFRCRNLFQNGDQVGLELSPERKSDASHYTTTFFAFTTNVRDPSVLS